MKNVGALKPLIFYRVDDNLFNRYEHIRNTYINELPRSLDKALSNHITLNGGMEKALYQEVYTNLDDVLSEQIEKI